jgi:hypothetical protein
MDSYATYDESSLRALAEPMVPQDIESVSYKRKDKLYINDSNNGSYSSGEITFDLRTIKDDLVLWRDAYVRGTVRVQSSGTAYTVDDLIAFRSGVHGLFDRIRVDVNDASTVNSNGLSISNRLSELMEKTPIDADSCSTHFALDYPIAGRLPGRDVTQTVTDESTYLTNREVVADLPGTVIVAGATPGAIADGEFFNTQFSGVSALVSPYGIISFNPTFVLVDGVTTRANLVANMILTPFNSTIAGTFVVVAGAPIAAGTTGTQLATFVVLDITITTLSRSPASGLASRQGWFKESAAFAVDSFYVPVQIPLRKICDLFDKMREPISNVYFKITLTVAGASSSNPFQTVRGLAQPNLDPAVMLAPVGGNSWRLYYDKVFLRPEALKIRNKMLSSKQAHFIQYRDSKLITIAVNAPVAGSQTIELSPGIKACRYVYIMTQARVHPAPLGTVTSGARVKASTVSLYSGLTSDVPLTNYNLLLDNNQIYARDIASDEEAYQLYRECSPFGFDLDKVGILSFSDWRRRYRVLCFDLARNNAAFDPAKSVQIQFRYEIVASNQGGPVYSDYVLGSPIPFDMYAILSYDASATINEGTGSVVSIDQ